MPRYIDADLIRYDEDIPGVFIASKTQINNIPTADVRENIRGKWKIYCDDKGVVQDCYCDQCGFNSVIGGNFCPDCGAQMER